MFKIINDYQIIFQQINQNIRYSTTTNNISIFFYIFYNIIITESLKGGAISIDNTNLYSLISICSFNTISTNGNGGAIYFFGSGIELNKLCGYNCFTTLSGSHGLFCYIRIKSTHKSYFDLLSVSYCSPSIKTTSYGSLLFDYGFKFIENINSSFNILTASAGFQTSYDNIYFKFNLFSNNSCNHIIFRGARLTGYLNYSNFINNKPTTANYGSFYNELSGNIIFYKCIFYNNNNYLFAGGYVTVDQCYISHLSGSLGAHSSIITNYFTITDFYNLNLLSNNGCLFEITKKKFKFKFSKTILIINILL